MNSDLKIVRKAVGHALSGKGAHVDTENSFAGLDWKITGTRPEGVPHSLFQLLNHMIYWQGWAVKWLDGKKPPTPKHASGSWPGSPAPASDLLAESGCMIDKQTRKDCHGNRDQRAG